MAFGDFTYPEVFGQLGLTFDNADDLFAGVAPVPPTMALARAHFGDRAPIVFGWIFACHQLGAAVAAWGAGWIRDVRAGVLHRVRTVPRSSRHLPHHPARRGYVRPPSPGATGS